MATVYGVNKTKALTPTPANVLNPGLLGGKVRCMVDKYECAATAAGTIIEVGQKLEKGAKILEVILASDNLANNTTLQVGDYEDDDRYIAATDHGAAALITRMTSAGAADAIGYEVDETTAATLDSQIIITTGVGEATGTISIAILYTVE